MLSAGVARHPGSVGGGLLGEAGQLAGGARHLGFGLVGAGPQGAGDAVGTAVGTAVGSPAPVAELGAGRATGGLDACGQPAQLADRPGQQPRVGRVADGGLHDRGVDADPVDAQHLGLGCGGQQRLVQARHRLLADPPGQLGQGGGVGHLPGHGDAAKPLPGDPCVPQLSAGLGHVPG